MRILWIILLVSINILLPENLSAAAQADSMYLLISNTDDKSKKAQFYHELAGLVSKDSLTQSIKYEYRAIQLADPEEDNSLLTDVYSKLGFYYYADNNYTKSISSFQEALDLSRETADTASMVKLLNNLGVITQIKGWYEQSLDYLFSSLEMKKILQDTLGQAKTMNNISVIYKNLGRYKEAYKFNNMALLIYLDIGTQRDLADAYNNLGTVYEGMQKPDTALFYYYTSLRIKSRLDHLPGMANTYNNIGAIYLGEKKYDSAYQNFQKARLIREKINDRYGLVTSYDNLGLYFLLNESYDSALHYFEKSLEISEKENMLEAMQRNYANLSRTYDSLANVDKAYKYFRLYTKFKDSITNKSIQDELSKLAVKYETEKIEQERDLLEKQYEIQRDKRISITHLLILATVLFIGILSVMVSRFKIKSRANRALEEKNKTIFAKQTELENALKNLNQSEKDLKDLNASKDRFFNIIAHDLKNPFNAIISFSQILVDEHNELEEEDKLHYLRVVHDTALSTSRLLENLLHWSRTQAGKIRFEPRNVDFNELLDDVLGASNSVSRNKNINILVNVPKEIRVWADENMLQTILRNLLSNAIKFSFENSEISINAKCHPHECVICVKDEGTGIEEEDAKNLFDISKQVQKEGTKDEPGTGLGLILCKEFIDYHKGRIWVNSEPGKGSVFCISLPIKELKA